MNNIQHNPKEQLASKELKLLELALVALQRATGIGGKIIATEAAQGEGNRVDAIIEIDVDGVLYRYIAEIKRVDRFAALGQVKNQLDHFPQPGLLVAPRITAETADKCRELDLQFIDVEGNAFLHGPGLYVWVKGPRTQTKEQNAIANMETPRGGTATALRVIFALLCQPALINAPYREINRIAGVALGNVGWIFYDLNNRGYVTGGKKKGDRRMLEQKRLIDEWVINYPIKLRPKLNPKRFHAPDLNWWHTVDIANYDAQWGGEVAADKLTGHLKPNAATIYMRPDNARQNLTKLVTENRLRADPNGEIEVLETFWDFPAQEATPGIVPPLLVYADLLATMDTRNFEVARMIYEERIHGLDTKT